MFHLGFRPFLMPSYKTNVFLKILLLEHTCFSILVVTLQRKILLVFIFHQVTRKADQAKRFNIKQC